MDEIDKRYSSQPLIPWMKSGSIKKENMRCLIRQVQACVASRTKCSLLGWHWSRSANETQSLPDQVEREHSPWHSTSVCIERVVSRKNHEILYTIISKSPRLANTITLKSNWRTNLGHNAEAPESGSQLASTEKLVTLKSRTVLDHQKEREYDQASTEKPVTLKKRTSGSAKGTRSQIRSRRKWSSNYRANTVP